MTAQPPLIIVSGLGRCGSSLVMQMLAAAGVPHVGTFPDFEDMAVNPPAVTRAVLEALEPCALKVLDPHRAGPIFAGLNAVVVWLDRDRIEQAASQIKLARFARTGEVPPRATRREVRAMASVLDSDRTKSRAVLSPLQSIRISYENLIHEPLLIAHWLADRLAEVGYSLDPEVMAACVHKSTAVCAPGLGMEAALVASGLRADRAIESV